MEQKPTYDQVLQKSQRILDENKKKQGYLRKIRQANSLKSFGKSLGQGFWIILFILIIVGVGYFGFTQKDTIATWIKDQVATVLNVSPTPPPSTSNTVTSIGAACEKIIIKHTQVTVTPSSTKTVTPQVVDKTSVVDVFVGKCYNIEPSDRDTWKNIFSDNSQTTGFAKFITDNSADKSLTPSEVATAISNSLKTFVLDLRKNAPLTSSTTAPLTTNLTQTPTVISSSATPSPKVTVVPFPEKELSLNLAELASLMKKNNIPSLASNNTSKNIRDKANWQVWYETNNGGKEYLVLNTLGKDLPSNCTDSTFIAVSLKATGMTGEVATDAGDMEIWIVCK